MIPGDPNFNPFPGLRPFQTEEEYLFFGREKQRQELIELLKKHRFVAVLGASGGGKSSLVRAGLLPALFGGVMIGASSHWNVAIMRPGGSPIRSLAKALSTADLWAEGEPPSRLEIETTLARSGLGLVELAREARIPSNENLLVVVDQFEELFRFAQNQAERSTRSEAAAFVMLLLEAAQQSEHSIYVVLTMRSDFFGDCAQFEDLAEAVNRGEYLVPRLSRDQKKQAIEGPIKVGGGGITPRLMQRLLSDVGDDPDQLPILQHALMRTWEQWSDDHGPDEYLDLRHYEGIGGMREALSRHADEVFASLPDDQHRLLAERLFKALTERGLDNRGIRRPSRVRHLCAITRGSESEVTTIIEAFRAPGRTFLMPSEQVELNQDTVIDISHESLMRVWQRLRRWVDDEAQSARIYSRLAETAGLWQEGKAGLYHDPDLQIALSWRETTDPAPAWAQRYNPAFELALEFLNKSAEAKQSQETAREAAQQRELERAKTLAETERLRGEEHARAAGKFRRLAGVMIVLALVALTALVFASIARKNAQQNAALAAENALAAEQNAVMAKQNALLAEKEKTNAVTAGNKLKETLTRADFVTGVEHLEAGDTAKGLSHLARSLRTDPGYWPAEFRLLSTLSERSFQLDLPKPIQHDTPIVDFMLSLETDLLATWTKEETVRLWDAKTSGLLRELPQKKYGTRVTFSPHGKRLLLITTNGIAQVIDPRQKPDSGEVIQIGAGITAAAFSPVDEPELLLATKGEDGSLRIWDALTGSAITGPLRDSGLTREFTFTPDGSAICALTQDGVLGIWESLSGKPKGKAEKLPPSQSLTISPDSRTLLLISQDGKTMRFWSVSNCEPRSPELNFNPPLAYPVKFSPDGQRLIGIFHQPAAHPHANGIPVIFRTFDTASGKVLVELEEKETLGEQLNENAGLAVTRNTSSEIKVWNLNSGKAVFEFPRPEKKMQSGRINPAGDLLLTIFEDEDHTVRIWNARTGAPLSDPIKTKVVVRTIAWSPDGERLMLSDQSGNWQIRDARTGQAIMEPLHLEGFADATVFSRDGKRLLILEALGIQRGDRTETTYGVLRNWNVLTGQALERPLKHSRSPVIEARFSPDGSKLLTRQPTESVYTWNVRTGRKIASLSQSQSRDNYPGVFEPGDFSPDREKVAICAEGAVATIWDLNSGRELLSIQHEDRVYVSRFSPDGKKLLTLSGSGSNHFAKLWDATTGKSLVPPMKHSTNIASASFSRDGKKVATAEQSGIVRIWDGLTGDSLVPPIGHKQFALCAVFSPDGAKVGSGSIDGTARIWNSETGQLLFDLPHQDWVWVIAFSSDGQKILTAGGGRISLGRTEIKLWDANTGKLIAEPLVCKGRVMTATFSLDGGSVLAGARDGTTQLWETITGKPLTEPFKHTDAVNSAEFSPDGKKILTGSSDTTARLWLLPPRSTNRPAWLPRLAETLGGRRFNDEGGAEAVPREDLLGFPPEIGRSLATDPYALPAPSWPPDRTTRAISPFSDTTLPEYFQSLAEEDTVSSLQTALRVEPGNAMIFASLARKLADSNDRAEKPWEPNPHFMSAPEWYSQQATNLAPRSAEAWWTHADLLDRFGKTEEALKSVERALVLDPEDANAWSVKAFVLNHKGQAQEAKSAYAKAAALAANRTGEKERKLSLLTPVNLMQRLNLFSEAAEANIKALKIPPRDLQVSSDLIDLTSFYNAALTENWADDEPHSGNDLAALPRGVQTMAGVKFDVRGLIQVARKPGLLQKSPARVSGIPIGRKCRYLHFLHAAVHALNVHGVEIGRYLIHYENGESREAPIRLGIDVADWWNLPNEADVKFEIAWIGTNKLAGESNQGIRLFKSTWTNPLPDVTVTSLDMVASEDGAPFLVALTQSEAMAKSLIVTQPRSQSVDAGSTVRLEIETKDGSSCLFQWLRNDIEMPGATNSVLLLTNVQPEHVGAYSVAMHTRVSDPVADILSERAHLVVRSGSVRYGALQRELYFNLTGSTLPDLTNNAKFPEYPDRTEMAYEAEFTQPLEYMGLRMSGYLIPPLAGEYVFYLASDDEGALFLSTDDSPANLKRIASEPVWNSSRDWNGILRRPKKDNVSAPITLTAGKRYAMELLMKQGDFGIYAGVTWQLPGGPKPLNGAAPIGAQYLAFPEKPKP